MKSKECVSKGAVLATVLTENYFNIGLEDKRHVIPK